MSAWRLARIGVLMLLSAVLITAGIYVLVYLARWEWNRAIVSGVFFLAALVMLSTLIVLRGLRRVEHRLDELERSRVRARSVITEENDRRAARHFEWLRRPPEELSVFIPVLLGAGALLSFVAYALERVSGAVAGPTLDRRTAELVAPDLPLGDGMPGREAAGPRAPSPWPARGRLAIVLLLVAVGAALAVDAIGDATQSRPEIPASPGTTTIQLEIEQRGEPQPPEQVAATLWVACQLRVPPEVSLVDVDAIGDGVVRLTLDHRLDDLHATRLRGCLGDLTLSLVLAEVHSVTTTSG